MRPRSARRPRSERPATLQTERDAQPVDVHAAARGRTDGEAVQELDQVAAAGWVAGGLAWGAAVERGEGFVEPLGFVIADEFRMDRIRTLTAELDPDREVPRTDELWYFEEREDVGDWFRRHGWGVTVTPSLELMAGYGRGAAKEVEDAVPGNLFVAAQRA